MATKIDYESLDTLIGFYGDGSDYSPTDKERVAKWVANTIVSEGHEMGEISFIFCSRERHLEINREFLNHDYPTDIITFDYNIESESNKNIISGDIFIDPLTVSENAETYNVTKDEEMLRVMIHGILHLCGYNDATKEEIGTMRAKENSHIAKY